MHVLFCTPIGLPMALYSFSAGLKRGEVAVKQQLRRNLLFRMKMLSTIFSLLSRFVILYLPVKDTQ